MTSLKPYLIRSIYEWIVDNNKTPYLLVDATMEHTIVPSEFIKDGKIILNILPDAIQGLLLGNEEIEFSARFSGTPMQVRIPLPSVISIYAKENGKGMVFEKEDGEAPPPPEKNSSTPQKPTLRVVK